jgi:hypothetical protein
MEAADQSKTNKPTDGNNKLQTGTGLPFPPPGRRAPGARLHCKSDQIGIRIFEGSQLRKTDNGFLR